MHQAHLVYLIRIIQCAGPFVVINIIFVRHFRFQLIFTYFVVVLRIHKHQQLFSEISTTNDAKQKYLGKTTNKSTEMSIKTKNDVISVKDNLIVSFNLILYPIFVLYSLDKFLVFSARFRPFLVS